MDGFRTTYVQIPAVKHREAKAQRRGCREKLFKNKKSSAKQRCEMLFFNTFFLVTLLRTALNAAFYV
jgi:hypothetical protein